MVVAVRSRLRFIKKTRTVVVCIQIDLRYRIGDTPRISINCMHVLKKAILTSGLPECSKVSMILALPNEAPSMPSLQRKCSLVQRGIDK
jgi:hypothetical protein